MRFPFLTMLLLFCGLLAAGQASAVAVDKEIIDDPVLEAQAREIMSGIRCLVCQNQSIEDSNADLARDLRRIVRERVMAGDNGDQVRDYLVARYGDWVLLRPPLRGRTLFLWFAPLIFLVLGGAVLLRNLRRRKDAVTSPEPLDDAEERRLEQLLDKGPDK